MQITNHSFNSVKKKKFLYVTNLNIPYHIKQTGYFQEVLTLFLKSLLQFYYKGKILYHVCDLCENNHVQYQLFICEHNTSCASSASDKKNGKIKKYNRFFNISLIFF